MQRIVAGVTVKRIELNPDDRVAGLNTQLALAGHRESPSTFTNLTPIDVSSITTISPGASVNALLNGTVGVVDEVHADAITTASSHDRRRIAQW
jgi:hypothetical protein